MSINRYHRALTVLPVAMLIVASVWRSASGQAEVRMKNNSVLYGEVKKLQFAKLTLDTDDFDLIEIDWEPIAYMKAPGPFAITLTDGRRINGSIEMDSTMVTISGLQTMTLPRDRISSFRDFDVGFWNRASAAVDFGGNFVRGNNRVTSISTGISLGWESDKSEILLRGSSIINEQEDGSDTRRFTASASADRETVGRLRVGLIGAYERDENQELDYRIPFTAFFGYRAIAKPRSRLDLVLGGGPTFEKYTGGESSTIGEGKAGFSFVGKPDGDTELDLSAYVYPGLFGFDRWRVESDLVFRVEIIEDLTFNTTAFYRFNNEPPVDVKKSDYGVTIGLGWSY